MGNRYTEHIMMWILSKRPLLCRIRGELDVFV